LSKHSFRPRNKYSIKDACGKIVATEVFAYSDDQAIGWYVHEDSSRGKSSDYTAELIDEAPCNKKIREEKLLKEIKEAENEEIDVDECEICRYQDPAHGSTCPNCGHIKEASLQESKKLV